MGIGCWRARRDLTALVDGELSLRRAAAVRRHLGRCSACAARAAGVEQAVARQRRLLPGGVVAIDVDVELLLRGVRRRLDAAEREPGGWLWVPALTAGALAAAVFAVVVMRPAGVDRPPAAPAAPVVARRPAVPGVLDAGARSSADLPALVRVARTPTPAVDGDPELDDPPEDLAERPDLFLDYRFFKRLDALEHFDTVRSQPVDASAAGPPRG